MAGLDVVFLQQEDLIKLGLFDWKVTLSEIEKGLMWHSSQKSLSDKVVIELDPKLEWKINSLIAVNGDYSVNKWLGSHINNKTKGLPRTIATITLNDKYSGNPICIMDGTLVSAVRTGCYAALGLKYLGHKKNNVGVIGSGVMARTSLMCMINTLPEMINSIFIYSRDYRHAEYTAKKITQETGMDIYVKKDIDDLVKISDVSISAITKSGEILLRPENVKLGSTHVHIGGWDDDERYIVECANHGKIICDDWNLIKKRNAHPLPFAYTKGLILERQISGNIGNIIAGELPGREGNENIYFDTVGIPEMDLVLAIKLYEASVKKGIGKKIKLWNNMHWLLES